MIEQRIINLRDDRKIIWLIKNYKQQTFNSRGKSVIFVKTKSMIKFQPLRRGAWQHGYLGRGGAREVSARPCPTRLDPHLQLCSLSDLKLPQYGGKTTRPILLGTVPWRGLKVKEFLQTSLVIKGIFRDNWVDASRENYQGQ